MPVSITAATGAQLTQQGITDVQSLVKIVPGFNAIDSGYGTPVYFLRGIGFFDSSLAAKPTVGIYTDEVPIPFAIMTAGASFDLERVEVLKGPQGTLFGQNATGGAINYIAAKPTETFTAGVSAEYGRFNRTELQGFLSGPLSDTVSVRVAARHQGGSAWQRSYTRDDSLGNRDFTQARVLLAWKPSSSIRINASLDWYLDRSDTQAAQLVAPFRQSAAGFQDPRLVAYPLPPSNDRAADWDRLLPLRRDNRMLQTSLRADFDISDAITLTSISSYARFKELYGQDSDGTNLRITDLLIGGDIDSFTQELRLSGTFAGTGNWIVGGNYEKSSANERVRQFLSENSSGHVFDRLGLPAIDEVPQIGNTDYESKAAFASVTVPIVDRLSASGGIRYTDTKVDFEGCAINGGNGSFGTGLQATLRAPAGTFQLGQCATLNAANQPALFAGSLDEDNVSWRGGLEFKPSRGQLIYANVSRGFKAGSFANLPATQFGQYAPVRQEQVTAYEAGFKVGITNGNVQLNGAIFQYDYINKQLKGRTIVPIFGPLEALVNIPRSRIRGAELQLVLQPIQGLRVNTGVTYLETEVTQTFSNYTAFGAVADFNGRRFPFTPKWQVNADADYGWPVSQAFDAYVGGGLTYRTSTNGDFVPDVRLAIDSYALLDLRVGIEGPDASWRVGLFGRNVTNKYYWQTAVRRGDAIIRFTGMPVTYGLTASRRF